MEIRTPTVVSGDIQSLSAFFHTLKQQLEEAELGTLDFTEPEDFEPIVDYSVALASRVIWKVVVRGAEDSVSSPAAIIDFYDSGVAVAWNTNDYFKPRLPSDKNFSWERACGVVRRFFERI